MVKAGFSSEIVLAKIKLSACSFDTSLAALKALKDANVPDSVILAVVQAPPGKDSRPGQNNRPRQNASYPTLQEILDRSVQALGGEAAIRKLSSAYGRTGSLV